jgi:hypothetical protein
VKNYQETKVDKIITNFVEIEIGDTLRFTWRVFTKHFTIKNNELSLAADVVATLGRYEAC